MAFTSIEVDFNLTDDAYFLAPTPEPLAPGTIVHAYDREGTSMLAIVSRSEGHRVWLSGLPAAPPSLVKFDGRLVQNTTVEFGRFQGVRFGPLVEPFSATVGSGSNA